MQPIIFKSKSTDQQIFNKQKIRNTEINKGLPPYVHIRSADDGIVQKRVPLCSNKFVGKVKKSVGFWSKYFVEKPFA